MRKNRRIRLPFYSAHPEPVEGLRCTGCTNAPEGIATRESLENLDLRALRQAQGERNRKMEQVSRGRRNDALRLLHHLPTQHIKNLSQLINRIRLQDHVFDTECLGSFIVFVADVTGSNDNGDGGLGRFDHACNVEAG